MTTTSRGRTAVRLLAVAGALTAVLLVAACGGQDAAPSGRTPSPTASTQPSSPAPTADVQDPTGVLESYGLALPAGASDAAAEPRADDTMTDAWLVTFTATEDEVEEMCVDAGIGAPRVSLGLDADELALYGVAQAPADARVCEASRPSDMRQQIRVLLDVPSGAVHVALYTMPER